MVEVRLDAMLKEFVPVRSVRLNAPDVRAVLEELEGRYPRLLGKLRDETGSLRKFVRVFVNGEDVGAGAGLATPLAAKDEVEILHSIAGG